MSFDQRRGMNKEGELSNENALVTSIESEEFLSQKIAQQGLLTDSIKTWAETFEQASDEELIERGREIHEEVLSLFVQQCLIAHIIARRHEGGLKILSSEWGVSYHRVSEMGRIWNKLIAPMIEKDEAPPLELEPEYFHAALRSENPEDALEYARTQKSSNSSFSCSRFRQAINYGMPTEIKNCRYCRHWTSINGTQLKVIFAGQEFTTLGRIDICEEHKKILSCSLSEDTVETAMACEKYENETA